MVTCSTLSYPSCICESFHTERNCKDAFRHLVVLVAQSCPTFCDPMVCIPPGSFVPGILQARILIGVGCHALLQGIFPTHGSNPGLPHYRQILYCLSHWRLLETPPLACSFSLYCLGLHLSPSLILPHLVDWTSYPISFLMQCSSPGLSPSEHKLIQKPTESSVSNRSFKNY